MTSSKVRIYDLAKELKLESKRVMEEARREGVDVSVPSNSISKELADKIRNKYFPKKETTIQRAVRVVKKAARPVASDGATEDGETHEADVAADDSAHASPTAINVQSKEGASRPTQPSPVAPPTMNRPAAARLVKRAVPPPVEQAAEPTSDAATEIKSTDANGEAFSAPVVSDAPATSNAISTPEDMNLPSTASPTTFESNIEIAPIAAVPPAQAFAPPPATSMPKPPPRRLVLTKQALDAGVRPGERVPTLPPVAPSPRQRFERANSNGGAIETPRREVRDTRGSNVGGGRFNNAGQGTPGETATPQTTYTPPADARRKGSRSGGSGGRGRGAGGGNGYANSARRGDARGGRFNDFEVQPRTLTLEERIRESISPSSTSASSTELKQARIVEGSTVKEFAEKLGIKPKDVVALLLQRGVFATINQPLNDEVAVELGQRFGFEVSFVPFEEMVTEEEFEDLIATDTDDVELPRAPVVTVMGHVDHGKTSLLDAIRTTDVAGGEAGGITQHIGAYSVQVANPDKLDEKRRVVFLDTPGHEAFTMMRARGAKATDVVVLVVAADDGVMPQTIEAIEHARAAKVPIVVAINKIDKPDANTDRVKQELSGHGLQPVEWGGETEMVLVSARQRENIDVLLETILLTTDILDLKASPTRLAAGVVLEAKLDRGRGSVATVLVQQGTLRVGDPFIAGQVFGKVRAMFDDRGKEVKEVAPATPVEVLGLQGVPQAGESFQVVADITRAQSISQHRQQVTRQSTLLQSTKRGIEALGIAEVKELLVILKADVQGSVEVLKTTLEKLSTEQVKVKVIRSGVGAITESDVLLASATQASASNTAVVIIGFSVRPEVRAAELAKQEGVDIRPHSIIYKVEEEIRAAMVGMLDAIEQEKILGKALVQQVFRVPKLGAVAGCRVIDGVVRRNASARLLRDNIVIWEGSIASLRRVRDDVSEVREGFECGIGLVGYNDIKERDQIEIFTVERVAATEL